MKLTDIFITAIIKRLSKSELSTHLKSKKKPNESEYNQHEFYTHSSLIEILGTDKRLFKDSRILYINDDEIIIEANTDLTWYDSRIKKEDRTSEYRFYYQDNKMFTDLLKEVDVNDLMIILVTKKEEIIIVFAQESSIIESQLLWLFNEKKAGRSKKANIENKSIEIGYAAMLLLESIGVEIQYKEESYLRSLIDAFGESFPTTHEFSKFTRETLKDISAIEDPDSALLRLCERETIMFKIFERRFIEEHLKKGFGAGPSMVNRFIKFSLSVQNRRKSRRGLSFENQFEFILNQNSIKYSRGKKIEKNVKPDFIFPSIIHYKDSSFSTELLTLLSLKTTAKERWKQIKLEATRIKLLHLLTLEPAIPEGQIKLMEFENIFLIVPKEIKKTYSQAIQEKTLDVKDFLYLVKDRQKLAKLL